MREQSPQIAQPLLTPAQSIAPDQERMNANQLSILPDENSQEKGEGDDQSPSHNDATVGVRGGVEGEWGPCAYPGREN